MTAAAGAEGCWQLLPGGGGGGAAAARGCEPPSNPGRLLVCGVSQATQAAAGGRPRCWMQATATPAVADRHGSGGGGRPAGAHVIARGSSLAVPAGAGSDDEVGRALRGLLEQLSAAMRVSREPAFAQVPVPTIFLGGLPSPIPAGVRPAALHNAAMRLAPCFAAL